MAGVRAVGHGMVARTLARDKLMRDLAPAAIGESQAQVAAGLAIGARAGLEDVGSSAVLNTAGAASGSSVGLLDRVPGFSSVRALDTARLNCGGGAP